MKRFVLISAFVLLPILFINAESGRGRKADEKKEALQELNDFIGQWKGVGNLAGKRFTGWSEKAEWSWKFKGKDCWLTFTAKKGKFFKSGEMRFLPDTEEYQLTLVDKDKKKRVFAGAIKGKRLVLSRVDPKTKEVQEIQMNNAAGGVRFIYEYRTKSADRTFFTKRFQVGFTKIGESFAATKRKAQCVVTGGLGTIAVSFKGQTYYVCCSGCREAFNENPAKIIAEYKKKRRGR